MQLLTSLLLVLLGLLIIGLTMRSMAMSREVAALSERLALLETRPSPTTEDADEPPLSIVTERRTKHDFDKELEMQQAQKRALRSIVAASSLYRSRVTRGSSGDLPLNFHPAAIRASAVLDTPNGAVGATGGNA